MKNSTFLSHQWKAASRSAVVNKNRAVNILMGFLFAFVFLYLIGTGFFIGYHFSEEVQNPIPILMQYGLYFFLGILVLRYMFQKLPTFMATPYLSLPIKKRFLVNFILTKPLFNPLNILPLSFVIAVSLGLRVHVDSYTFWLLFTMVIIIDTFLNYLSIYIKRIEIKHEFVFYIFLAIIAGIMSLDRFDIIDLKSLSSNIFMGIIYHPIWLTVPLVLGFIVFELNFYLLYKNFSLEDFWKSKSKNQKSSLENFNTLNRFGKIGSLALLELKMYIRNKRPRNFLFFTPFFLFYGIFMYSTTPISSNSFDIFIGLFITGGFMLNLGLYFFSWESSHFDLILTLNNSFKDYIKAKYYLMIIASSILFILSTFYVYFGVNILIINSLCFLFNIGVNSLLILYFGTNNKEYMDLSKGSAFNYQGVSIRHFFIMIPLLVLPIIIYLPFRLLGYANIGLATIGILGILGILFREKMLHLITQRFLNKRYRMAAGFRKK